ncbi:MFS transporter [Streptomyces ipomoeae]|uniref:MFS transporter n=1 Tax=Streptomyces ipomoeae TaxID=103232 RepID=UPI001146782B|nr:MFS transporter [Streptomyces ipomoeae]MDX2935528.1 MFS transporter [Streptomyces ipomoeae]TQE18356.1 MFS transporter [Streptomyces ipomoeae]
MSNTGASRDAAPGGRRPVTADAGPAIPRRRLAGWAVGAVACNAFNTLPGLLLLMYLTDALGVAAGLAGLVVALPKLWDVVLSPWVGSASDREAGRTGGRRRLMTTGAIVLPIAFVLTFSSPLRGDAAVLWVFLAFIAASTAYLMFQVPFMALPSEMSALSDEHSRIMTWRTGFFVGGMLIGGVGGPLLAEAGTPQAYRTMSLVVAVVLAVCLLLPVFSTRWVRSRPSEKTLSLPQALRSVRGSKPFVLALSVLFVMLLCTTMTLAGLPYVATYYMGGKGAQAAVFLAFAASGVLCVPLLGRLARRIGTLRMLTLGLAAWAVAGSAGYLTVQVGVAAVAVNGAVLGVLHSMIYVSLYSLLPECVRVEAARTGQDQAGAFSGVWTAVDTAAHAVGPLGYTLILTVTGYASSTLDHPVTQSDAAREGLLLGFSVIPSVLVLATLPLLARYRRQTKPLLAAAPEPAALA